MKKPTCPTCKSTNVWRDALIYWDNDLQDWSISTIFDNGGCADCDAETKEFIWIGGAE
jgi:hypothetical protein